jgi:hypothetical protein
MRYNCRMNSKHHTTLTLACLLLVSTLPAYSAGDYKQLAASTMPTANTAPHAKWSTKKKIATAVQAESALNLAYHDLVFHKSFIAAWSLDNNATAVLKQSSIANAIAAGDNSQDIMLRPFSGGIFDALFPSLPFMPF